MTRAPVLAGFYPDPTVCRVGQEYYLACSSFEYHPGVPLFRSRDLVRWTQLGNVLTTEEQLVLANGAASRGIYAPTLRYHAGRFWLITTNVFQAERGHLVVHAEDPAGPWSAPVFTTGIHGIDPDLAWDADGTCYLTWAETERPYHGSRIAQLEVDPETGELRGPKRRPWNGTGLANPEAPHLYRIGDWWYLLIAEGGTERGHSASIARARTPTGPFEPAPGNPILTHRSTAHPVQNTGHGDLVETVEGDWAMVYLGVRPRGGTPGYHVNGRETFLAGVEWIDGWPGIDEDRYQVPAADHSFDDDLRAEPLDPRWISPGAPARRFTSRAADGGLVLHEPDSAEPLAEAGPGLLAVRVRDEEWSAEATVRTEGGVARLVLRIDEAHWYAVEADPDEIRAFCAIGPSRQRVGSAPRPGPGPVTLRIAARAAGPDDPPGPDVVVLGVAAGGGVITLAELDGRYLSTEVAGGFTGRVIGVRAVTGRVRLDGFGYRPR